MREEVAFLQGVKVILTKREIGAAVVPEDVVDIFDAVGLDKPNNGLLDDAFPPEVGLGEAWT